MGEALHSQRDGGGSGQGADRQTWEASWWDRHGRSRSDTTEGPLGGQTEAGGSGHRTARGVKTQLMGQTHREDLGPRQADRGDWVAGLMEEAQATGTDRQVGKVLTMGQTEG